MLPCQVNFNLCNTAEICDFITCSSFNTKYNKYNLILLPVCHLTANITNVTTKINENTHF